MDRGSGPGGQVLLMGQVNKDLSPWWTSPGGAHVTLPDTVSVPLRDQEPDGVDLAFQTTLLLSLR